MSEQMPLADVKNRVDDLESLQETLDPVALTYRHVSCANPVPAFGD